MTVSELQKHFNRDNVGVEPGEKGGVTLVLPWCYQRQPRAEPSPSAWPKLSA